MLPTMPIFTVQPVTAPAPSQDPDRVLDRLTRDGALGPAVSIDSEGRVSATYQVEADDATAAAVRAGLLLSAATGIPSIRGVTVWAGEGDDDEAAATG